MKTNIKREKKFFSSPTTFSLLFEMEIFIVEGIEAPSKNP